MCRVLSAELKGPGPDALGKARVILGPTGNEVLSTAKMVQSPPHREPWVIWGTRIRRWF